MVYGMAARIHGRLGVAMPRCIKCGNVYSSKHISGVCDQCSGTVATKASSPKAGSTRPKTVKPSAEAGDEESVRPKKRGTDSSASEISLSRYEEEVAKIGKRESLKSRPSRNRKFNAVSLSVFSLLIVAALAVTYLGFGLTKHFALWSVALVFFFIGAAMILTKRLIIGRAASVDRHAEIEPAAASIVGGLCLLPLVMCTFYYGFNSDLPSDRVFWMTGSMSLVAFLALAGVAYGLAGEGEEPTSL